MKVVDIKSLTPTYFSMYFLRTKIFSYITTVELSELETNIGTISSIYNITQILSLVSFILHRKKISKKLFSGPKSNPRSHISFSTLVFFTLENFLFLCLS